MFALCELRRDRDLLSGRDDRETVTVVALVVGWIVALRRVLIGRHCPHVRRIDAVSQVKQTASGGPLDESVKDFVNDVFKVGEEAIDRVAGRRSIEPTAQPNDRVPKLSLAGTNAVDIVVVAMEEATHQLW